MTGPRFLKPKGILRNSQSPKGVTTAVFGMYDGAIGICFIALSSLSWKKLCNPPDGPVCVEEGSGHHQWNRVAVVICGGIQSPVVATWTPFTISFRNLMERCGPGGLKAAKDAHVFHLEKLCFSGREFCLFETPCSLMS